MPLNIVRDDLVNAQADAIVLPSNTQLVVQGGAGEAVARKAGRFRVRRACRKIGGCPTGSAVHTPAFSLPARYLIHAVGPVWQGSPDDAAKLRSAYDAALELSAQLGCASVALPLLSAGSFGCPAHVSLSLALASIEDFLAHTDLDVTLVLFDKRAMRAGLDFIGEIESRIDDAYVENAHSRSYETAELAPYDEAVLAPYDEAAVAAPDETAGLAPYDEAVLAPPGEASTSPQDTARIPLPRAAEPFTTQAAKPAQASVPHKTRRSAERASAIPRAVRRPYFPADAASLQDTAPGATSPHDLTPSAAPGATSPLDVTPAATSPHDLAPDAAFAGSATLEERLGNMESSFSETLLALIDESGKTDAEVYRRANMTRQHFSKIRNNVGYRPSKPTVLALCVALQLDLGQTRDLLARAGFALTHASKFDIILEYFIERGMYDPFKINETLFYFDQPLIGG